MPYVRCASCGVLSYTSPGESNGACPECGIPAARGGDTVEGPDGSERCLDVLMCFTRDLFDVDIVILMEISYGCEIVRCVAGEWFGMDFFEGVSSFLSDIVCQQML